jgi:predicted dehydrogenase
MKRINWGIIGCGDVTEVKSGPAFNKVDGSQLVAVMRRNGYLAKDYAIRHHVPFFTDNADELINHPQVNAVYVATPPETHALYAIKAMQANKPVYVEKPMAVNYQQCVEMNRVSQETGIPLFVAYYRRTLPGYLKVKELVEQGFIGDVISVNIEYIRPALKIEQMGGAAWWRVNPEVGGAGLFFDLASHQFDFLDFLFGEVTVVNGLCRNVAGLYKAEDTVVASFQFANGVTGTGTWCFVSDEASKRDVIVIHGTKGRIVFSAFNHSPIQLFTSAGCIEFPYLNPDNIQYNLIRQIVEVLHRGGNCVSTGVSAARTSRVIEKIVESYYQ